MSAPGVIHVPKVVPRKKAFRFNAIKDINLLKATLEYRPWEYGVNQWESVANMLKEQLSYDITGRGCRLRVELLMAEFKKDNLSNLRKSGTEEEYTEREFLMNEIIEANDSFNAAATFNKVQAVNKDTGVANPNTEKELSERSDDPFTEFQDEIVIDRDRSTTPDVQVTSQNATESTPLSERKRKLLEKKKADEIRDKAAMEGFQLHTDENAEAADPNTGGRTKKSEIPLALFEKRINMESEKFAFTKEKEERELDFKEKELRLEELKVQADLEKARMANALKEKKQELEDKRQEQQEKMWTMMVGIMQQLTEHANKDK